jgi:hypothetical protein
MRAARGCAGQWRAGGGRARVRWKRVASGCVRWRVGVPALYRVAVIEDGVVTLQFVLKADQPLPGAEESFQSALRPAVVGRLSLSGTVRANLVLPYAVEVRVDPLVGSDRAARPIGAAPSAPGSSPDANAGTTSGTHAGTDQAQGIGRPREFAVVVGNDPQSPAPYSRFAIKGVSLARQVPTVSDDIVLELDPGEYFLELRRGSSWQEVEHPVALNRVSYFAERQAAGRQ